MSGCHGFACAIAGVSVAVAVGVSDWWQVTGDRWNATRKAWHLTPDTWHVTGDTWHQIFVLSLICCPFSSFSLCFGISATICTHKEIQFLRYAGLFCLLLQSHPKCFLWYFIIILALSKTILLRNFFLKTYLMFSFQDL